MQPARLCSAPPVKAVFGISGPCKHRTGARAYKTAALLACRHSNKLLGACIHSMPHASPTARRDTLARAEERDSLLVRRVNSISSHQRRCEQEMLVTASACCAVLVHPPEALAFTGSTPGRNCIIKLFSAGGGLAHDIPGFLVSCHWGPLIWL